MKLFTLKRFFVVTLLICLGLGQSWAGGGGSTKSDTRYAPVGVGAVQSGYGKVYVSTSSGEESSKYQEEHDGTSTNGRNRNNQYTYYRYALAEKGYVFVGWYSDETCETFVNNENGAFTITSAKTITYEYTDDKDKTPKMHEACWNSSNAIKFYAKFVTVDDYLKTVIEDKTGYAIGSTENNALYELLKNNSLVTEAKNANDKSCDDQTAKGKINSLEFDVLDEANDAGAQPTGEYDAVLVKRSFTGGRWNTFCVPFDMTTESLTDALGGTSNGVDVKALTGVTQNTTTGNYTLQFGDPDDQINAGQCYIVWVKSDVKKADLVLGGADANVEVDTQDDINGVTFQGTYFNTTVAPNDGNFIIYANEFHFVNNDFPIKAFRGYFHIPGATTGALGASFDDDDLTGIIGININDSENGNDNLYNIAGQRVNENAKGIIIKNGKKYFVK